MPTDDSSRKRFTYPFNASYKVTLSVNIDKIYEPLPNPVRSMHPNENKNNSGCHPMNKVELSVQNISHVSSPGTRIPRLFITNSRDNCIAR